jgi:hypothetical protein
MDWLATILTSSNAVTSIVGFIIVIVLLAILSSLGLVSFKGNRLSIGKESDDRKLLIDEMTLARAMVDCIPVEHDDWKKRVIVEDIYNKIQDWIVKNNIRNTPQYITAKQYAIKSIKNVFEVLEDPDSFVEVLINELVELKKEKLRNDK